MVYYLKDDIYLADKLDDDFTHINLTNIQNFLKLITSSNKLFLIKKNKVYVFVSVYTLNKEYQKLPFIKFNFNEFPFNKLNVLLNNGILDKVYFTIIDNLLHISYSFLNFKSVEIVPTHYIFKCIAISEILKK